MRAPRFVSPLATVRPPQRSRWLLLSMLVGVALAFHAPGATGAGIGLAVLTAVLCCLWLRPQSAAVALGVLPVLAMPWPMTQQGSVLTLLGSLLLVVAGLTVSQLTRQMLQAQGAVLVHLDERAKLEQHSAAEQARLSSALQVAASCDPLTGALNRSELLRHLDEAIAAGEPVGILVFSLSRFGAVNEALGTEIGDALLAAVAARLMTHARDSDRVGRLGGDEFGVLLANLPADAAQQVGDRLKTLLDKSFTIGTRVLDVTSRSGLALHDGDPGCGAAELLRRASAAAAGPPSGTGTTVFDPIAQAAAAAQLELELAMREGIDRGEFFLDYQPKVCTRTGRMTSVEALVRWRHPVRGLLPPDLFIGLAERTGLIVPLGMHVLTRACEQLREWSNLEPELTMAVNVSVRQLEPDFVERVEQVLSRSGVDPRRLILELTESLLVADETEAAAVLWRLRGLGVRLSLDDFGTGYSSLARLGSLPLDELKIDKSFVDRLGSGPSDSMALVTAAVAMGHGLGLRVVAEGVEDAEQLAVLTDLKCDVLQGYLLGRPQTPEAVAAMFAQTVYVPADRGAGLTALPRASGA